MSIYDDMRSVASELMAEFKQGIVQYVPVVSSPGTSPHQPGQPTRGTPVTLNATAKPVSTKYVDSSHVVQSDKEVVIPNDGRAEPSMNGFIRIDGVDHKIIELMPRPAAGEPITWTAIVRR